jgi:hypothetical protein
VRVNLRAVGRLHRQSHAGAVALKLGFRKDFGTVAFSFVCDKYCPIIN